MEANSSYEVLEQREAADGTVVEILQYNNLRGSDDVRTAERLFFASQSGMRLKLVRIRLKNAATRLEPGALYYMRGRLEMASSSGGGLLSSLSRNLLTGETLFLNQINGTGDIYLEPTFGHFFLFDLREEPDGIIVDKGSFFAGTGEVQVDAVTQKTLGAAIFGGEGLFQTRIRGNGIVVLYSPVPAEELERFVLDDEKLSVDGHFTLLRSAKLTFRVEKSSKSWVSTSVGGEGLLQTFEGSGRIWVAPTQPIYEKMATPEGLLHLAQPPGKAAPEPQPPAKK